MSPRLLKNTIILSASQVISRLLSFTFSLLVARYLGVEQFGMFTYSLSLIALFSTVVDFGLSTLTVREMIQDRSKLNLYFFHAIILRYILAGLLYSILYFYSASLPNSEQIKQNLLLIMGLYLFVRALFDSSVSFFQSQERQDIGGYLQILNNFSLLIIGLIYVMLQKDVLYFATAHVVAGLIASIVGLTLISFKISFDFRLSFNFIMNLFKKTIPFGFTFFVSSAYARMDILMLSWLRTDLEVGEYGASLRIIDGLLLIPIVGNRILYPYLSRISSDSQNFQFIVEKSIKILVIASFYILAIGIISADWLILTLFPVSFKNSAHILQVLIFTLIAAYPNYILGSALFSLHRQNMALRVVSVALIVNIISNLFFIPLWGTVGAAVTAIISGILILTGYIWALRDKINSLKVIKLIGSVFLISSSLILPVFYLKDQYPLYIYIIVFSVMYPLTLYALGLIKYHEIEYMILKFNEAFKRSKTF